MRSFDPGLANTAIVHSNICSIDGEAGILRYRGYRVEQLVERCSYLEVAFLLIHGELPTRDQLAEWNSHCMNYTFVHEDIKHICSQVWFLLVLWFTNSNVKVSTRFPPHGISGKF